MAVMGSKSHAVNLLPSKSNTQHPKKPISGWISHKLGSSDYESTEKYHVEWFQEHRQLMSTCPAHSAQMPVVPMLSNLSAQQGK